MKWMNLKDILLSEISQSHKDIVLVHLEEVHRAVKFIETESRIEIFRDGRVTDELVQSFGWRWQKSLGRDGDDSWNNFAIVFDIADVHSHR